MGQAFKPNNFTTHMVSRATLIPYQKSKISTDNTVSMCLSASPDPQLYHVVPSAITVFFAICIPWNDLWHFHFSSTKPRGSRLTWTQGKLVSISLYLSIPNQRSSSGWNSPKVRKPWVQPETIILSVVWLKPKIYPF